MTAAIIVAAVLFTFAASFAIGRYLSQWPLRMSLEYAGAMTLCLSAISSGAVWLSLAVSK